jgi:uncharacterized protein (DUF1330 family)
MTKGYWIASVDILDMEGMQGYRVANQKVLARHGAKFLVAGGKQDIKEGEVRSRQTVVEFESYEAALAAFDDPDYQEAAKLRRAAATGALVIVEGFAPPKQS